MGKRQLTDKERSRAYGEFAELSDGLTHYELKGEESFPLLVLIHGISSPAYMWEKNFSALVKAGFRVLRYDLYGRGYSDRPDTEYNKELYLRQLVELLDYLKIKERVHVVGLSFGGLLAVNFCAAYPQKADKLILIDPAGFYLKLPGFLQKILESPFADFVFNHFLSNFLPFFSSRDFYKAENFSLYQEKYKEQVLYDGFSRALLSTARYIFSEDSYPSFEELGKQKRAVALIWGEKDTTVPFKYHRDLLKVVAQTRFFPIKQAAHMPHCEHPEKVNKIMIDFLREN